MERGWPPRSCGRGLKLLQHAAQPQEIFAVARARVGAADHIAGVVHRITTPSLMGVRGRASGIEGHARASDMIPGQASQAGDYRRGGKDQLGVQEAAALGDLTRAWIAIASLAVARAASYQVGDKDLAQAGLL